MTSTSKKNKGVDTIASKGNYNKINRQIIPPAPNWTFTMTSELQSLTSSSTD